MSFVYKGDLGSGPVWRHSFYYEFPSDFASYPTAAKNLVYANVYNFVMLKLSTNLQTMANYYKSNLTIPSTGVYLRAYQRVYGGYYGFSFVALNLNLIYEVEITNNIGMSSWDIGNGIYLWRGQGIASMTATYTTSYGVGTPTETPDSIAVNTAIKTLAYVEKKIYEYNRKVSVSVQNKVTNGDVAGWVVAVAGAIGEGFQSATSSSVGAAFVKEMKEFTNLFKFTSGLVNGTKSSCVIDIGALETSAQSNLTVTFSNVKAWFNVVGLPAVYKTALGCQTILGKLAMPMASFMAIAPKLEGDHEEYIYLTADNAISTSVTDKRIVIKGKLTTSDYWDLYSQAMIEEFGDSIANGSYSTTANDVSTAAEAYAQQQQTAAQNAYYNAMSTYYQNANASGGTANLGTVTLASGQTISLATGQKVDLNIATGTAVPLTVPETTKVGLNILDGQAISLDLSAVESMTPLPIEPVQWDNNSPPPWFTNPIELHLSDNLANWTLPNIKIDTPVIPPVTVPDVNVKVDVNVPSIPDIKVTPPVIPNIKIDTPTLPNIDVNIPEGSAITLTPPTSIPLTAPTEPVPMTFDTASAESIKAISDNIALRNELETTRAESDTVLRDLQITNETFTKDNQQVIQDKLYADLAVSTSEAAFRGEKFGSEKLLEYVPAQVQAYNNLHDLLDRESIALGQTLSFPQGLIPSLVAAHFPALLAEIQQSKITENIRSENQTDDSDWDLESTLMKLLFFDVDSATKTEVMQKYGDEINQLLKILTPLGVLAKVKEFMGLGD